METESQSNEISEFAPDKIISGQVVDDFMKILDQSEEAAYKLFLRLKLKYGAGKV